MPRLKHDDEENSNNTTKRDPKRRSRTAANMDKKSEDEETKIILDLMSTIIKQKSEWNKLKQELKEKKETLRHLSGELTESYV